MNKFCSREVVNVYSIGPSRKRDNDARGDFLLKFLKSSQAAS